MTLYTAYCRLIPQLSLIHIYKHTVKTLKEEERSIVKELKQKECPKEPVIKILPDILSSDDISSEIKSSIIHNVIESIVLDRDSGIIKIYYK